MRRPRTSADKYHGVVKFDVVTGAQAKAKAGAPAYTKVFAQALIAEAEEGRQDRRHHRRHAFGHRARPFRQGVSRPLLRCRHRRAARRDLRRRPCDRRPQAVRRHLFDLPAARLRPGGARRRHPEAAGALRHGPRRTRRRRRTDPCRRLRRRLSRHACPASSSWRRPTKPSSCTWSPPPLPSTTARRRCATRAAKAWACRCPAHGQPLEIGKGRILREGTKIALFSLRRASCRLPHGRRRSSQRSGSRPRWRMRALPSRSTPTCCCASRASTRCSSPSRRARSAASARMCCTPSPTNGVLDGGLKVRPMVLPDVFIDQDSPAAMYAKAGLDAKGIVAKAFEAFGGNLRGEAARLGRA